MRRIELADASGSVNKAADDADPARPRPALPIQPTPVMSYLTAPPLIPLDTPADLPRIRASFHALVASILGDKLGSGAVDADVARLVQNDLDDVRPSPFLLGPLSRCSEGVAGSLGAVEELR